MAHVMVLDTANEDIFVCGLCKSVFNSLQLFLEHKQVHQHGIPEGNYLETTNFPKPPICENIPQSSENECEFTEDAMWTQDICCRLCNKKFKRMKSLLAHLKIHSEKAYQCLICGRCFIQNSHLQRHIASHKVWPGGLSETTPKTTDVELLSYSCPYCNLVMSNYGQYRSHLKNHMAHKKFKCIQENCTGFFDTVESLLAHVSAAHEKPVYTCHICNKLFESLEDIAIHHQTHNEHQTKNNDAHNNKLYKCSQCDSSFKKQEKLSLHMLTENHKKTCIHCSKTFASDKRLRLHLQIHRKFKPFQCHVCNSSFHVKKYLSAHMLKHGEKQYTCNVCKHTFKRQDLLQRHMKSHQPRKSYQCPFKDTLDCKKEFNRSDKLKLHVKHHTKHIAYAPNAQKLKQRDGTGTVEICIVPVDTKDNVK